MFVRTIQDTNRKQTHVSNHGVRKFEEQFHCLRTGIESWCQEVLDFAGYLNSRIKLDPLWKFTIISIGLHGFCAFYWLLGVFSFMREENSQDLVGIFQKFPQVQDNFLCLRR